MPPVEAGMARLKDSAELRKLLPEQGESRKLLEAHIERTIIRLTKDDEKQRSTFGIVPCAHVRRFHRVDVGRSHLMARIGGPSLPSRSPSSGSWASRWMSSERSGMRKAGASDREELQGTLKLSFQP